MITAIHPVILDAEIMLLPGNHRFHLNRLCFCAWLKNLLIWWRTGKEKKSAESKFGKYTHVINISFCRMRRLIILMFEIAIVGILRGDRDACRDLFLICTDLETEAIVDAWVNAIGSQQITVLVTTSGKGVLGAERCTPEIRQCNNLSQMLVFNLPLKE